LRSAVADPPAGRVAGLVGGAVLRGGSECLWTGHQRERFFPVVLVRFGWWRSKSGCFSFLRRQRCMRGGCSACAPRESAWCSPRPCTTTTRQGSRPCGPTWTRRRPAIRDTLRRRRDADAASTALSTGHWTRFRATCATPHTSMIRGSMPRSPAPGVYSWTERARLARIALAESAWPSQAWLDEASRMLRDCYGVPVGGVECIPEWVTANVRPGGGPPDGEGLSLDLARLNL